MQEVRLLFGLKSRVARCSIERVRCEPAGVPLGGIHKQQQLKQSACYGPGWQMVA